MTLEGANIYLSSQLEFNLKIWLNMYIITSYAELINAKPLLVYDGMICKRSGRVGISAASVDSLSCKYPILLP